MSKLTLLLAPVLLASVLLPDASACGRRGHREGRRHRRHRDVPACSVETTGWENTVSSTGCGSGQCVPAPVSVYGQPVIQGRGTEKIAPPKGQE